jgi:tetratricopeptide (TPR) repeat protein
MTRRQCVTTTAFILTFAFATGLAPVSSVAQTNDISAIQQRFLELYGAGNYGAALNEALGLESAVKARFGEAHANYGAVLHNLGVLRGKLTQYVEAEELLRHALAVREKALGESNRSVADTLYALGDVYARQARNGDAETSYKRALAIQEKALSPIHPDVASTLNDLGMVYEKMGRLSEAEASHIRALAIRESVLGKRVAAFDRLLMRTRQGYVQSLRHDPKPRCHHQAVPRLT